MPEHTPAPTHARSIYGFVLYLASCTLLVIYICWTIVPDGVLNGMNIYYYPQKYWAVAIPIQLLVALTLFAFIIYPSLNMSLTPKIDSIDTIVDNSSVRQKNEETHISNFCDCKNKNNCYLTQTNMNVDDVSKRILHVEDLNIVNVCRTLYGNSK